MKAMNVNEMKTINKNINAVKHIELIQMFYVRCKCLIKKVMFQKLKDMNTDINNRCKIFSDIFLNMTYDNTIYSLYISFNNSMFNFLKFNT
jgi:hypothetical protein